MKPEEQQRAIAEYCGIKDIHYVTGRGLVYSEQEGDRMVEYKVPNYLHDLNAMREAESSIVETPLWFGYNSELKLVCGDPQSDGYSCHIRIHAKASQKAEAFLRAIGKWTD